jgi:murein L,D-transpeptidase YcbB/YkuD
MKRANQGVYKRHRSPLAGPAWLDEQLATSTTSNRSGLASAGQALLVWLRFGLLTLVLLAAPAITQAEPPSIGNGRDTATSDQDLAGDIKSVIDAAQNPYLKRPRFPSYQGELQALYGEEYQPVWLVAGKPRKPLREVIDILLAADTRGLNPDDYDAKTLERKWRELQAGAAWSARDLALFDTAVSIALLRQLSDLHRGRINPKRVGYQLDIESKQYDLATLIKTALEKDSIPQTVAAVEPAFPQYQQLQEALQHYRRLAQDPTLKPVPVQGVVKPGQTYAGLPPLRRLLTAFGDLRPGPAGADSGNLYTGAVVEAVKRFQGRHGLAATGVLDKATYQQLNVPLQQRVQQIALALERLRWLPELGQTPLIIVDIPAFQLWVYDHLNPAGGPVLKMKVIVGKSLDKQTPVFLENMRYVVFRPYWNVPPDIAAKEILPAVRKNPKYLASHDMELVSQFGDNAVPLKPTSSNIAQLGTGAVKVRQRPGPRNALGLVKFIFPNNESVYLHSTPQEQLFKRTRRDFSHGCVRVEQPVVLAEFVLHDRGWNQERVRQAMNAAKSSTVSLNKPLPVLIFYTTVLADGDGTVSFYEDIYGYDAQLKRALLAGHP